MKKITFTSAIIFLFLTTSVIISQQTEKEETKYRRITPEDFQLQEQNKKSKEEVFPLGWNTGTLGKATTGAGVWTELNPGVPRVDYIGLDFINADTGWACGMSGAIIKTTNGGDTWSIAETPVTSILLKIHSFNSNVVIATGWDGVILRSDDGGENFTEIANPSGTNNDLWGVQMLNDTLGWICGTYNTLMKTTDAGLTWNIVSPGLSGHYWSLEFLDEHYGFIACADGKLLKTTDGGESWQVLDINDDRDLLTVDIIDSLHIAAAGVFGHVYPQMGGINIYSSDGGDTWIINTEIPTGTNANWIEFENRDIGYTVNEGTGGLRKTTDRGESWFAPNPMNYDGEWQIDLLEDGTGYYGGEELNFFKRTDRLDNWGKVFLNENFSNVFFISENKGFIISSHIFGHLHITEDGGENWSIVENAPFGNEILFLDSLTGFIGAKYKSIDGGATWQTTNYTGGTNKLSFINKSTGWAAAGGIYKTTDGGENWFFQASPGGADSFDSIYFIDSLNGWATSRHVWQTTDGGTNWIERTDIPATFVDDVYFPNSDTGWISTYSSINPSLFKTTDGGVNWEPILEVIGARKFDYFPDKNKFMIIGFSRYYLTNNGGNNWTEFTDDVPNGVTSFYAPKDYLGYAVGSDGLILKYRDTAYVPVELISFTGNYVNNKVSLKWVTASELNNYGFEIQRAIGNYDWQIISFVPGDGTTTEVNHYSFNDNIISYGKIKYRLKQVDFDGTFEYSNVIQINVGLPEKFSLKQNYPNPFNPTTTISYSLPFESSVTIEIFDVTGSLIQKFVSSNKAAGHHKFIWDGKNSNNLTAASGVYIYRFIATSLENKEVFSKSDKMMLVR